MRSIEQHWPGWSTLAYWTGISYSSNWLCRKHRHPRYRGGWHSTFLLVKGHDRIAGDILPLWQFFPEWSEIEQSGASQQSTSRSICGFKQVSRCWTSASMSGSIPRNAPPAAQAAKGAIWEHTIGERSPIRDGFWSPVFPSFGPVLGQPWAPHQIGRASGKWSGATLGPIQQTHLITSKLCQNSETGCSSPRVLLHSIVFPINQILHFATENPRPGQLHTPLLHISRWAEASLDCGGLRV